jgi:hypothetical protein
VLTPSFTTAGQEVVLGDLWKGRLVSPAFEPDSAGALSSFA